MTRKVDIVARAMYIAEPVEVRMMEDKDGNMIPCSWEQYPYQAIYVRRAIAAIGAINRMPKVVPDEPEVPESGFQPSRREKYYPDVGAKS